MEAGTIYLADPRNTCKESARRRPGPGVKRLVEERSEGACNSGDFGLASARESARAAANGILIVA